MENKEQNQCFRYTYSAKEQSEIRQIREKYITGEEDKMTRLRRLDKRVNDHASTAGLIAGISGTLIMGFGMSLAMTDLGIVLGMTEMTSMIAGVAVGILGMIPMGLAYPVYCRVLKKEREKIAPEILQLTDELMK